MYIITEKQEFIGDKEQTVYGIKCEECYVDNVSSDKAAVMQLIEHFNKYELSPIHLFDEIEDFITGL